MAEKSVMLFDSHAHLEMLAQKGFDVDEVIQDAFSKGMKGIVTIAAASEPSSIENNLQYAKSYSNIWVAAGVHPHNASEASTVMSRLEMALDNPKIVAVGEIGLDYHYNYSPPKQQRDAFISQLRLAHKRDLPVVIHTRNADDDMVSILKDEGANEIGGVIHCFSSGERLAHEVLDLGFYISFSGIVTFPKSTEIQRVATWIPQERILCETDSPFLSPVPKRGKSNEPSRVAYVVQKVAQLRDVAVDALALKVVENTRACFRIQQD